MPDKIQIRDHQIRELSLPGTLAIAVLFWAALYLPGLGTLEIQGEEGRRLLPAITMTETGDWVTPKIGGKVYQRKPPLINWMAAASFSATGVINEWTGRLPSALATLAFGLCVAAMTRRILGSWGALFATVFTLGNISMIEKGRLAEIEAIYMVCTGMAILWWCVGWLRNSSPWLIWLPVGFFLGLGWLAKGPLLMLFFYAAVLPTLWYARRQGQGRPLWRELASLPHIFGLVLMLCIFGAWAVANLRATAGADTGAVWLQQFTSRLSGAEGEGGGFNVGVWARNFPRALVNFLPWVLFLPLLWRREIVQAIPGRDRLLFLGLRRGMVLAFFILLLPPGSSSRFAMPMLIMPALLLAMAFTHGQNHLPAWLASAWRRVLLALAALLMLAALACAPAGYFSAPSIAGGALALVALAALFRWRALLTHPRPLLLASMTVSAAAILIYVSGVMPRLPDYDDVRPVARELQQILPADRPVYAIDAGFQPVFFYLRTPLIQIAHRDDLPSDARLVMVREDQAERAIPKGWAAVGAPLMRVAEEGRQPLLLMELAPLR